MSATLLLVALAVARPDLVVADFEKPTYGTWTVTGTAFGTGPARGALPGQMAVEGFRGGGFVNSYLGGDEATGTLTSPPFRIERENLRFLLGGGKDAQNLRVDLLVDGKVVRTATGPNDRPGGSETLTWTNWNVEEFAGQSAIVQIVDAATGGWGHLNVDHLVLTDQEPPKLLRDATRTIRLDKTFLNLPVKNGAKKRWVTISVPGEAPRRFDIELADGKPNWWAFMDVSEWKGKTATVGIDEVAEDSKGFTGIALADGIKGAKNLYREELRPQFHFSSRRGWLNDPNGLVYYKGEYHLFYQHNPYGWGWGNMSWGHAVSRDLVRWKELPVALHPDALGTMYSGSAVVDAQNTAGFKSGTEDPLVAMYTAAGKPFTQGLASSTDRGRTWTKYAGNPVMPHIAAENRDPKVIWHAPTQKWIMALYLDGEEFALYDSKDLKSWREFQRLTIPGTSECPNFFPLPVDGDASKTKWVFFGANGGYLVGDFDGNRFTAEGGPKRMQEGNCWYAAQVFSDIPASDGRTILIPWGQLAIPGMPFNQILGIPVELTLKSTENGPVVCSAPARELKTLRTSHRRLDHPTFETGKRLTLKANELAEIEIVFTPGSTGITEFDLRGVKVAYDAANQEISCLNRKAKLPSIDGKIRLHGLVDRTSVDLFGNDGRLSMPMGAILDRKNRTIAISAAPGTTVERIDLYGLESSWR